jgi:membrane fusion protein, multidrug efflux system
MNIRLPDTFQTAPTGVQSIPDRLQRATPRYRGVVIALTCALAALAIWYLFFRQPPAAHKAPPPTVRIGTVGQENVTAVEHSIATVVSPAMVSVTAQVTGQLLSSGFKEGQIVRSGDVLFRIDPKPFEAALLQAQAALARDQANYQSAANDKLRYATLAAQGAASTQQRDQATATADADAATVKSDKAAVDVAQLNLGYTVIRSPINGKTGPILIQPGNLIVANASTTPLVTITQVQPIKVSLFLPQSDLPRIEQQMHTHKLVMTVDLHNGPGGLITALVDFVGNQVSATTGTIELRATFPNTDNRLVPGQYVDAAVALNEYSNAIVAPHDAINLGPDAHYLFVVNGQNKVEMRPVTVLYDDGTIAAIKGNAKPGDHVIVEGQLRVVPGGRVTVVKTPAPPVAGAADPGAALP